MRGTDNSVFFCGARSHGEAGDEPARFWIGPDSVFNEVRQEADIGPVGPVGGVVPVGIIVRTVCIGGEKSEDGTAAAAAAKKTNVGLLLRGAMSRGDEVALSMVLVAHQAVVVVVVVCGGSDVSR